MSATSTIFDFSDESNLSSWSVVDDVVMGGKSNGKLYLSDEHHGIFEGHVSLENNGGFSSVRHRVKEQDISNYSKFILKIKGDGKRYQFRAKKNDGDYQSYITYFDTDGNWQIIEIPFDNLEPAYRGRMLDMPNFPGDQLEEVAFLIGNKRPQDFRLEIDYIKIK